MASDAFSQISLEAARTRIEAGDLLVIDVRAPFDYAGGRIPGSINLPGRAIESRWQKIPAGRALLFVDDEGDKAAAICALALSLGLKDVALLEGGFEAWLDAGYPTETITDGLPPLDDA